MLAGPACTHTQSRPNDHPFQHQVTTPMPTWTYSCGACLFCQIGWESSSDGAPCPPRSQPRIPPSLAPTRTHVHASVPTHNSATYACTGENASACIFTCWSPAGNTLRGCVLFFGTQISNLYTAGKVAVSVALLLSLGTRHRRLSCLRRTAKVSAQDARRRSGVAARSEAELTAAIIVLLEQHCEGLGEGCRDQGWISCT